MAFGLEQFAATIGVVIITCYVGSSVYMKGYLAGMRKEAFSWIEAIGKVTPPNWQSLPFTGSNLSSEMQKDANKMYAMSFRIALDIIKDEIAENRLASLLAEVEKEKEQGSKRGE